MPLTYTYPEFTDIPREAVDDPEELYHYLSSLVLNLRELRGELAKVLTSDSTLYELFANKGQADGYTELDGSGDVPDAQIPSLNASKITAGILAEARVPFESPGPIGGTTADAANFTTLGVVNEAHFGNRVTIENTTPELRFIDTNQPLDEGDWEFVLLAAGTFNLRALTEAGGAGDIAFSVARTGTVIDVIDFGSNKITTTGIGGFGSVGIDINAPDRSLEIRNPAPIIRLRDTGIPPGGTNAYLEFGETLEEAWSRTGWVGDDSNGDSNICLWAEVGDLKLGDSSGDSVLVLSGGNATFSGNVTLSGAGSILSHDGTTDSSSPTTGSIHTDGGLGVVKKSYFGADMDVAGIISVSQTGEGIYFGVSSVGRNIKGNVENYQTEWQCANGNGGTDRALIFTDAAGSHILFISSGRLALSTGTDIQGSTTSDIGTSGTRLRKLWIQNIDVSGTLKVGVDDTTAATIWAYGAAVQSGGRLLLYNPGDADDLEEFWSLNAFEGTFRITGASGNSAIVVTPDADVSLRYNGNQKLATTNTGISVIGDVVASDKVKLTSLGGLAVKLTNKTGGNTVKGNIVAIDNNVSNDDSVVLAATSSDKPIGVFLDAGVADGSEAWVVISGIADVLADSNGWLNGDRVIMSMATTAGTGQASNTPVPSVHLTEIGHALEDATSALGRCILHFN